MKTVSEDSKAFLCQGSLESGMLKLHLDNGEAYPCFFTSSQVYGQVCPVSGTRVEVCARLVSADNSVSIVH